MPRLDGTGPQGLGSGTGRGQGRCGNANSGRGLGRGQGQGLSQGNGRGFGFGRTFMNNETISNPKNTQEQIAYLNQYKNKLETEIRALELELNQNKNG